MQSKLKTMPQFDVITINEKHLARVNAVRKDINVYHYSQSTNDIGNFLKWKNYIKKQLANSKALTSIIVQHIFE